MLCLPSSGWIGSQLHRPSKRLHHGFYILILEPGIGHKRQILRLDARVIFHEPTLAKDCVHPVQKRLLGAAVLTERQALELTAVLHRLGYPHVCAAETVDRLFVVSHDEQLSGSERERVPRLVPHIRVRLGSQIERDLRL